jgi:ABC-type antimicrobial peptide transport system permease subunit
MTTTRSLPGIAPAPHRAPSATARIVAGIHKSRLVVRGVPIFSLLVLAVTVICALFAPALAPYDPIKTNPAQALSAPSLSGHLPPVDSLWRELI